MIEQLQYRDWTGLIRSSERTTRTRHAITYSSATLNTLAWCTESVQM